MQERGIAGARERGLFRVAKLHCRICRVREGEGEVCLKRDNSLVFGASEVIPASIKNS